MKTLVVTISLCFLCSFGYADCVGKIISIEQDERTGSVKVSTEYTLNDVVVQTGNTRYNENSGTLDDIKDRIQIDIEEHCGNLIARISDNEEFFIDERLKINKSKTKGLMDSLKETELNKESKKIKSKVIIYKGKKIELKDDSSNTIIDVP